MWFSSHKQEIPDVNPLLTRLDALEREQRNVKADMDDLWERVQRHQAKVAARARRELAKAEDDPHVDSDEELTRKIQEGLIS